MQSSKVYMRNNFYYKDTVNGNIKIKLKCNSYVKIISLLKAPTAVYLARTYMWNWDCIFQMACEDKREYSQSAAG